MGALICIVFTYFVTHRHSIQSSQTQRYIIHKKVDTFLSNSILKFNLSPTLFTKTINLCYFWEKLDFKWWIFSWHTIVHQCPFCFSDTIVLGIFISYKVAENSINFLVSPIDYRTIRTSIFLMFLTFPFSLFRTFLNRFSFITFPTKNGSKKKVKNIRKTPFQSRFLQKKLDKIRF